MIRFPKIILIGALALFSLIGIVAFVKKGEVKRPKPSSPPAAVALFGKTATAPATAASPTQVAPSPAPLPASDFPTADRILQLFTTGPMKLPIVETVTYTSSVPWLKGRPAWIADYAAYYATTRHFIARSLNGKADYLTQKVIPGSRFNVLRKDKNICFYLLVDLSRCKMGFYYVDLDSQERVLLKSYTVGVGCLTSQKKSGSLTPLGRYSLGSKVAIYKPGMMGLFQNKPTEMIQVFGSRWIPFEQELEGSTEPAKGYGIHGAPWVADPQKGQLVEDRSSVGKYESDGCIRLFQEDMEELFAIIISRPTFIDIVPDYRLAKLPGVEKQP